MDKEAIRLVDPALVDEARFARRFVGCIVLSHDSKIVLQQRDSSGCSFPDHLATFGGGVEPEESAIDALVRELNEELGAVVDPKDVVIIGVFTEAVTDHSELIYGYFWQDAHASITGCYEGQAQYYDTCSSALAHPKVTDDLRWLLQECIKRGLARS